MENDIMGMTRTEHISVDSPEQFIGLFGIRDENIPLFREELGVEIFTHGGEITLTGDPEKVSLGTPGYQKYTQHKDHRDQ